MRIKCGTLDIESAVPTFIHRRHLDGSWDSICESCYLTVIAKGNVGTEVGLQVWEAMHVCDVSEHDDPEQGEPLDSD